MKTLIVLLAALLLIGCGSGSVQTKATGTQATTLACTDTKKTWIGITNTYTATWDSSVQVGDNEAATFTINTKYQVKGGNIDAQIPGAAHPILANQSHDDDSSITTRNLTKDDKDQFNSSHQLVIHIFDPGTVSAEVTSVTINK